MKFRHALALVVLYGESLEEFYLLQVFTIGIQTSRTEVRRRRKRNLETHSGVEKFSYEKIRNAYRILIFIFWSCFMPYYRCTYINMNIFMSSWKRHILWDTYVKLFYYFTKVFSFWPYSLYIYKGSTCFGIQVGYDNSLIAHVNPLFLKYKRNADPVG